VKWGWEKNFPKTPPTRTVALGAEERAEPGGWIGALLSRGFRIEGGDGLMPPCRVTEYPGVCVYVEQWDKQ
jgi:hypothetical protein